MTTIFERLGGPRSKKNKGKEKIKIKKAEAKTIRVNRLKAVQEFTRSHRMVSSSLFSKRTTCASGLNGPATGSVAAGPLCLGERFC